MIQNCKLWRRIIGGTWYKVQFTKHVYQYSSTGLLWSFDHTFTIWVTDHSHMKEPVDILKTEKY